MVISSVRIYAVPSMFWRSFSPGDAIF
jgi:hypothetical protein